MADVRYLFAWSRDLHVYLENGVDLATGPESVEKYIANLGEVGWEYCGSLPERDGLKLIFKKR